MATTQTTTTLANDQPAAFYDRLLLQRLLPNLAHQRFAQKRIIPLNTGKTINIRRFESIAANTTALTEGTVPAGEASLTITALTSTVSQYGDFVQIDDMVDLTSIDPVLTETAAMLGEQAGNSLDQVIRGVITAGTAVQYAGGVASRATVASADILSVTEIRKAKRTLSNKNARPVDGSNFVGIIHPFGTYDIQGDTAWVNLNQYAGGGNVFEGEIGKVYGVRFVETSNGIVFTGAGSGGIDVYGTLILGKDAYVVVDLEGAGAVRNIIKPLGSAGTADPLNQIATSGWKAVLVAKVVQDNAMVRIEHAVSS